MAKQDNSLKKIQDLLDKIKKGYESLGEKSPFAKDAEKVAESFDSVDKTIQALTGHFQGLNERLKESNASADDLLVTLQNIAKEINPKAVNYTKDFEKGFKKVIEQAKKLSYEEEGFNKLSKKELEKILEKVKIGEKQAKFSAEQLLTSRGISKNIDVSSSHFKKLNEEEKAAVRFLQDQNSNIDSITNKIKRKIELENQSNKV